MVTVITKVRVRDGAEEEWDSVFAERADAVRGRPGFVSLQLCRGEADGGGGQRVIVGAWERLEDWEAWHHDPEFLDTRRGLEHAAADGSGDTQCLEVILERHS
jgi:heme-degrading monooxygenase HmoA